MLNNLFACATRFKKEFCHSVRNKKMTWTVRRGPYVPCAHQRGGDCDIPDILPRYVTHSLLTASMWLTAADSGACLTRRIQKWRTCFNNTAACNLRCDQSGRGGETVYSIHTLSKLCGKLWKTGRNKAEIDCAALAKGDMPNILLISY